MKKNIFLSDNAFTYPFALMLTVVTAISLMAVQAYWSTIMKKEREKELLFAGEQIRDAIGSYCSAKQTTPVLYPQTMEELLLDSRFPVVKRHLRKMYKNPMSKDGKWYFVFGSNGKIKGVYANNREKPLKQENFPEKFKTFEKKNHYSDWKFIYEPLKK